MGTDITVLASLAELSDQSQPSTTSDVQLRMLADCCWLPMGE